MKSVVELYIDDNSVELGEDTIIALTRQVNNLGELKDRQTDFTNTFSIPKSNHNQDVLGLSDNIHSTEDKQYQKALCKIVRDGIEIVQNGIIIIESVKENYEINILSGNANFVEEIGDKKIIELTDLDVDTDWNRADIITAIGATSGIFWPILDRGVFDNSEWADTRSMWPAIFVHDIIGYIFTAAGFNKAGDYLDSDEYKKLVLPYISIKANDLVRGKMAAWKYANNHSFEVEAETNPIFEVKFASATKYDPYLLISEKYNIWRYSVPSEGLYKFTIRIVVNMEDWHGVVKFQLKTRRGNMLVNHTIYQDEETNYSFDLDYEGYMISQDGVYVEIQAFGLPILWFNINIEMTSRFKCSDVLSDNTAFGCQVPCGINLPDITQKELLKALAYMHCLIFITDSITKTVHFIKFSEIIENKRIAYDWSDKLDLSKDREPELKFKFGKYGQSNFLKYKEDEDVELELGDDSFLFDDKTLPLEKTLIEMPFAATENKEVLAGINCATIKCQEINKGHILDADDVGGYHSLDGVRWILTDSDNQGETVWFYGCTVPFETYYKFDEPIIKQHSPRILAVEKVADVGDDIKFYEGNESDFTEKMIILM